MALLWLAPSPAVLAQATGAVSETVSVEQQDVLDKLRGGGYIIYLRHTETNSETKDTDLSDMNNCSTQRVLSEEGREHATKLGNAFKALNIPVGKVITSQFCRAKETTELMGFDSPEVTGDLDNDSGDPFVTEDESKRRSASLGKLLTVAPEAGKNTLIVGHVPNIRNAISLDYANMKEGEMAIFAPGEGSPGYEAVARITPDLLLSAAKTAAK